MEQDNDPTDATSDDNSKSTPKPTSGEPRSEFEVRISRPDFQFVRPDGKVGFGDVKTFVNSTGDQIGGTINVLDALSETMKQWGRDAITGLQPGLDQYFAQHFEPMKIELESKIQDTRANLSSLNGFITDNRDALTTLISVNGQMPGLKSDVSSALKRIEKLETDKVTDWNKNSAIAGLAVGCAAGLCTGTGTLAAFMALYLQFIR